MNSLINKADSDLIESRIKKFEISTGCELLLILAKSSDQYPAASWRFGILSAFSLTFIFSLFFEFHSGYLWPIFMLLTTLLMAWIGKFSLPKKLALSKIEIDRECFEKAVELFHTLGTTKVSHKVTAMIMVSALERKITVLVDETLKTHISQAELDELVQIMKHHFKLGNMAQGFIQSIDGLEAKILKDFGGKVSDICASELKDQIHFI